MGSGATNSDESCRCGNAPSAVCAGCRRAVCRLCVRTVDKADLCLACRSSALKRDEERRFRASSSSGRIVIAQIKSAQVRRSWVVVPAVIVGALAILSSVVGSMLSEVGAARTEHRARDALTRLFDAENAYRRSSPAFASLEALRQANLVPETTLPGYQLHLDVAKDGHTFWARAVPEREGLRGMIIDARGVIAFDGGGE